MKTLVTIVAEIWLGEVSITLANGGEDTSWQKKTKA
jgi:hypothetical protein